MSAVPRWTAAELAAARSRTIPDVLPGPGDPPLRVLFSGINPGLVSAATGHHFARPGNRFWPALHEAGFTPCRLLPAEQGELAGLGLGVTNLVSRATARAGELTPAELVAGGQRLRELVERTHPAWLAVVGITAYRTGFAEPHALVGPQDEPLGGTRVWVLPNPSGRNAHYRLPDLVAEFARLHRAAAERR
jgi:double-stranded uracil-DNA glycosylase